MGRDDELVELYRSLDGRMRPEDVADLILVAAGDQFTAADRAVLERAAAHAYSLRRRGSYTSMSEDFTRPVDASRQIAVFARLFGRDVDALADAVGKPSALLVLAAGEGAALGWRPGADFKTDRLARHDRAAHGLELSRRQYNRAWRFLTRFAAKIERVDVELRKRQLLLVGRSGLVADITLDRFRSDPAAACFVAYLVARRNLRRQFSLAGKGNPFDEVADMLYRRLGDDADWWMVSRVHTAPETVARLTGAEQGELLGRWSALMRAAAQILERAWDPRINRTTMIVQRGMDSSTWNTIAQAYNTARDGWITALAAAGALDLLEAACPGKVMRLMAADLAAWHRSSGSDVDPDTAVWAALPPPWEVLSGAATCTREYVAATCARFHVDAARRGWVAPRTAGQVAAFTPTPELVHGVSVADPVWAGLLRRAGVFSGKRIRGGYEDLRVPAAVVTSDLPAKVYP